jgi:hypothetical protein
METPIAIREYLLLPWLGNLESELFNENLSSVAALDQYKLLYEDFHDDVNGFFHPCPFYSKIVKNFRRFFRKGFHFNGPFFKLRTKIGKAVFPQPIHLSFFTMLQIILDRLVSLCLQFLFSFRSVAFNCVDRLRIPGKIIYSSLIFQVG